MSIKKVYEKDEELVFPPESAEAEADEAIDDLNGLMEEPEVLPEVE